jgi:hypothetical protein
MPEYPNRAILASSNHCIAPNIHPETHLPRMCRETLQYLLGRDIP